MIPLEEQIKAFEQLREIKSTLAGRGWFPATSGNLSIRIGEFNEASFQFAITASGKDKSVHTAEDYLIVDQNGAPTNATKLKPSAETSIHCEIYRLTGAAAILHVHTVFNNLASGMYAERGSIPVQAVELIKAFNIWDQDAQIEIPILPNYADVPTIVPLIEDKLDRRIPGIMLDKHGIYAWGDSIFAAKRHLEAFEFLSEYVYRLALLQR